MKKMVLPILATLALASNAEAAPAAKTAPVAKAPAASSGYDGKWMIRARALGVIPQEDSALNIGGEARVDAAVVPELDFTYFFTPNVAVELIAGVTPHDVHVVGSTAGSNVDAGSVWLLPPTLTLQYHFTDLGSCKPYVGAGVNYTHFFGADRGALSNVQSYDDSFGGALQAGVDVPVGNNWYFNVDVKKVFISTTAKFNNGGVVADVDINPWLVGMGVGYRF